MDIENNLIPYREERKKWAEVARKKVTEMRLPKEIDTPPVINGLGRKIETTYRRERDALVEEFGPDLPKVIAAALHEYWFACWEAVALIQSGIEDGSVHDNERTRKMATVDGYPDIEGSANTLFNGLADLVPHEERVKCIRELTGLDPLTSSVALHSMAVYWLTQAAVEQGLGNTALALDLVHEAHDALAMCLQNWTHDNAWTDGSKTAEETIAPKARSDLARKAGRAAQAESHALKAEVKEFWQANMSPSMSNDAAATILMRQFPLKFRTLSRYVSDFKNTVS